MLKNIPVFLFATITLFSSANFAAAPTNKEIRIGISQEFDIMHSILWMNDVTFYVMSPVTRNMTYLAADGEWKADIAQEIPTLKNGLLKIISGKDGKKTLQVVWKIKEAAKWADGVPITCEDLKLAWEIGNAPTVAVGTREDFREIAKIEWDPKTPKVCNYTYDSSRWNFYKNIPAPLPNHLERAPFEKFKSKPDGYLQNSNYTRNPTLPGLYNGPYYVSEHKNGSHVMMVPNPHFFGTKPKIQRVIFKVIGNTSALEANLLSGSIDLISTIGLSLDQSLILEKKIATQGLPYNLITQPSLKYEHIDLMTDNPKLSDKRVRKAMLLSLNREELTQAMFKGKLQTAHHFLVPIDPAYTEDPKFVTKYPFNRREAARLLDEAGWKMGSDGIRLKDGVKLSLKFMTTAGDKVRETVQTLMKDQWKTVGIEVNIKNEPARVLIADTLQKRKFDSMILYYWTSTPEGSKRSMFHSSQIPSSKNGFAGENYPGWKNAKVDELLIKIDSEFEQKARIAMTRELAKEYTEELPVLPLFYRADVAVIPKNLKGFVITGHYFNEMYSIENWNLE